MSASYTNDPEAEPLIRKLPDAVSAEVIYPASPARVMVIDSHPSMLGATAFRMTRLGADVHLVTGLDEAELFLAPSVTAANGDQEGIPVVLMEAMAMGLPCMFTRVGLMKDEHRPTDVYLVDPVEMFKSRRRLIEEFGRLNPGNPRDGN